MPPPVPSLLARLAAAEDAGEVDVHQLADLLGLTAGALRTALAAPAALTAEQAEHAARALGVDRATMRTLRRGPAPAEGGGPTSAAVGPTGSTLALLEATLAAVAPDAAGRALCAAVLDVAESTARAAGRPLPPGAHALRRRYAAPDVPSASPDDGGAGDALGVLGTTAGVLGTAAGGSDGASPGDPALVDAAAALVRDVQRAAPGYDDLFAPLHDDALADLLRRHTVAVHEAPGLAAGTRAVLTPPLAGRHRLVLSAAATPDQRRLVARAAAAHLVAGHVGEHTPLASPAPAPLARLADTVALADLVPFWQVADLRRRGRLGWRALAAHVADAAAHLAGDWPPARAADRGALRVALYRAHGL